MGQLSNEALGQPSKNQLREVLRTTKCGGRREDVTNAKYSGVTNYRIKGRTNCTFSPYGFIYALSSSGELTTNTYRHTTPWVSSSDAGNDPCI